MNIRKLSVYGEIVYIIAKLPFIKWIECPISKQKLVCFSFFDIRLNVKLVCFSFFDFRHSNSGRISHFDIQNLTLTFELSGAEFRFLTFEILF